MKDWVNWGIDTAMMMACAYIGGFMLVISLLWVIYSWIFIGAFTAVFG